MMYRIFDIAQCERHGNGTEPRSLREWVPLSRGRAGRFMWVMERWMQWAAFWSVQIRLTNRANVRPAFTAQLPCQHVQSAVLFLPSAHVLGFRVSAALSSDPCMLV
jgi:hypothetical protein